MGRRVRLTFQGSEPNTFNTLYISNSTVLSELTGDPKLARKFHSPINGREFIQKWYATLNDLGVPVVGIIQEEYDAAP